MKPLIGGGAAALLARSIAGEVNSACQAAAWSSWVQIPFHDDSGSPAPFCSPRRAAALSLGLGDAAVARGAAAAPRRLEPRDRAGALVYRRTRRCGQPALTGVLGILGSWLSLLSFASFCSCFLFGGPLAIPLRRVAPCRAVADFGAPSGASPSAMSHPFEQ